MDQHTYMRGINHDLRYKVSIDRCDPYDDIYVTDQWRCIAYDNISTEYQQGSASGDEFYQEKCSIDNTD